MKKFLALCLAAALLIPGCVKVDNSLGEGLIDKSLLLNTYTVDFPLSGIALKHSSDLSAYSDTHLTIGSIRDEAFGLTTRDAAFTLIPALDEIDLGPYLGDYRDSANPRQAEAQERHRKLKDFLAEAGW